jgi:ABC-type phosphate/phosphonate transport system substrate-binding protein
MSEMTAAEQQIRDETELVEAWRAEQLEMAGYGAQAAAELAMRQDVDLHTAIDLLASGCQPDLALKILL